MRLYDTDLNILTPKICFQAMIANGSNVLLLIPGRQIDISEELEASVSRLLSESDRGHARRHSVMSHKEQLSGI
jgi:hypothetical protein